MSDITGYWTIWVRSWAWAKAANAYAVNRQRVLALSEEIGGKTVCPLVLSD
jgi:hypothetical protein